MTTLPISAAALVLAHAGLAAPGPCNNPPADPPVDLSAATPAVAANNAFGLDLFRLLASQSPNDNLFISPYSISIAMTMTAEGARGETEAEMARVMRFPIDPRAGARPVTQIHTGFNALSQRFAAAQGSADPQTRERIAALRKKLDDANKLVEKLQNDGKWDRVSTAHESAEQAAAELNALLGTIDRFDFRSANALWVDKTYDLAPVFVQTIDRFYGTGHVTALDFGGQTEKSRVTINTWVENNTENRIKDLIPPGILSRDTCLVLTNAVYFLGQWSTPFEKSRTREADFTLADGRTVKAKLMCDPWRDGVPYAAFTADGKYFATPHAVPADQSQWPQVYPDDDGFSMIQLPYKGGDLAMVLIAPRTAAGLPALERTLSAESLGAWLARFEARRVDTALPRFRLESARDLAEPLKALGMKRAFTNPLEPGGAEFPGICASEDPAEQPSIGAVLHKAWVEVNEVGTEAAAATAVIMVRAGAAVRPVEMVPFIPKFHADHPFLFIIHDTKTGVILFVGRIARPQA
ncbi:MAG: serpin family protein [Phycisphaeraceae bacterium]|nr:serpin family protein [Phycisphaeraceae bacterium]